MFKQRKPVVGPRPWGRMTNAKKNVTSNGYSFSSCYMELCKQQRIRPLPVICVTLPNSLEFTPDRVKMDEWDPILTSLSLDRVLRSIRIHSRCQNRKPLEDVTSENKARKVEKMPLVLTRYILERLSQSVAQCIRNSSNLTCLELEGIPLTPDCVAVLCVGISSSKCLQYLSLCRSYIGDNGCELVCQTITNARSIKSLNLSQCNLTSRCGNALATALLRQKLSLYHDTWKLSLRYREPNFDAMPGLRRLTLNGNPHLGNSATNKIIDAVRDSLWIRALDFQNCGLTNGIGNDVLDLVTRNTTLIVVDVRLNSHLDERIVDEIMRKLDKNNANCDSKTEYKWIDLPGRRVSSAACLRKVFSEKRITRAKSAIAQQSIKRSVHTVSTQKIHSVPLQPTVTKAKSLCLNEEHTANEKSKASLLIDLQAEMISRSETTSHVEPLELVEHDKKSEIVSVNNDSVEQSPPDSVEVNRYTLIEKIEHLNMLLNEERMRRKIAEEKLDSMKRYMLQVGNRLKQQDEEMRGYVIVSQDSLDEMCASFNQLLEDLHAQKSAKEERKQDAYNPEDIKKWMVPDIRRTRSESTRRRQFNDGGSKSKKVVKSESNFQSMESSKNTAKPINIERNIGDGVDVMRSPSVKSILQEAPVERSRNIFNQLVNSDSVLNYKGFQY